MPGWGGAIYLTPVVAPNFMAEPFPFDVPGNQESIQMLLFRIASQLWAGQNQGRNWVSQSVTVKGGSAFTPLPPAPGVREVQILNTSGVNIDVKSGGGSNDGVPGTAATIYGAANGVNSGPVSIYPKSDAGEILVKRTDNAASDVTLGVIYKF